MIIGVILNNFKCYKGLHYIPLTNANGSNFCGLIGMNGVGKSAVLEALDCFFNDKPMIQTIDKDGENSYVIPFFFTDPQNIVHKIPVMRRVCLLFKRFFRKEIPTTIPDKYRTVLNEVKAHFDKTLRDDSIVFPLINTFNSRFFWEFILKKHSTEFFDVYPSVIREFIQEYKYIYVYRNMISDGFAIFETEQIQRLLGIDLIGLFEKKSVFKYGMQFIDHLLLELKNYTVNFENNGTFTPQELFDLISPKLFSNLKFFATIDGINIPLSKASSGEKQKAVIDLIYYIVNKRENKNLILAVDEPESSFHLSECFEQFNTLYDISKKSGQVLFTSHWYGFIPSIPDGCVVNIVRNGDRRDSYVLNVYNYREQIQFCKEKAKKEKIEFPIDILLKGKSDLVQSIVCSIVSDDYYNWLICEGTSDKIYLEGYFTDEIQNKRLRIISMGGCGDVFNIYEFLTLSIKDLKGENVKGKVFFLVDTDAEFHSFETNSNKILNFKRVVNDEKTEDAILVENQKNPKLKTDIEDALNGKVFNIVLNKFKEEYPFLLDFVDDKELGENSSFYAMDLGLGSSKYKKLDSFFNEPKVKGRFARAYVEEIQKGGYKEPSWITEIKNFFK